MSRDGDQFKSFSVPEMRDFVAIHRWTFARTMRRQPHDYVLLKHAINEEYFFRAVMTIRRFGHDEQFKKSVYRVLEMDRYKFWTMGEFLETTWVINRARIYRPARDWHLNPTPFKPRKGSNWSWGHAKRTE